ncbi:MAG: cytochrome b N-terminal domain-containing protein [Planctomycetaceae bacterium]|nr:cytochrome b N-terminal domain-containing protein [Planctomycetaceae bacterium]
MNFFAQWLNDRTGLVTLWKTVSNWTVPKTRCCCSLLPTMIVFAFLTQAITGIVLWLYYAPSSQTAWESVFYMQYILPYGWLVRGIHHYSAQVLVGMLGLYLLIMLLHGKYRTPREFVFWTACAMFGLTLGCCVTGDLLSWTLSGFSATKVRVSFLNLLPEIGPWLYKLAVGGADFGTLTLPRFLLLHIAVCGGGFFAFLVLWKWCTIRARNMSVAASKTCSVKLSKIPCCCESEQNMVPFWSCEAVKQAFGCVLLMGLVLCLVFQGPLLGKIKPEWAPNPGLPFESTVGAPLHSPADPADFYGGARPEWSFRALYYFSSLECFPGEKKYLPIFVIPSCLALYFFLVPFIGRVKIGHCFNVLVTLGLFGSVVFMTYKSYEHDAHLEEYQRDLKIAKQKAERAIELALAPDGIPPTGALSLLQSDPKIQGPILYKQHCASCHPFEPMNQVTFLPPNQLKEEWDGEFKGLGIFAKTGQVEKEPEHPDFPAIACDDPSAPNLYNPIRPEWIVGFFDFEMLKSDDVFGKTAFCLQEGQAKADFHAKMYDFARTLPARMEELELAPKGARKMIDVLVAEAERDEPRAFVLGDKKATSVEGLDLQEISPLLDDDFGCLVSCHRFYDIDKIGKTTDGPDLTGYMSRRWMIDFIKNPADQRFYGTRNDRMPSYHLSDKDSLMSEKEIEMLVDWLRGKWYRK